MARRELLLLGRNMRLAKARTSSGIAARMGEPSKHGGVKARLRNCVTSVNLANKLVTPGRGRSFPADRVRTKGGARLRAVVQPHPLAAGGVSF